MNFHQKKGINITHCASTVVSAIKPDKMNIRLNESLFNAQFLAKQSSTLIKDIQRDVQTTLKKYDDYLKSSETNRKTSQKVSRHDENNRGTDSNGRYSERRICSEKKMLYYNEIDDNDLDSLREQKRVLMQLLVSISKQEQKLQDKSRIKESVQEQEYLTNKIGSQTNLFTSENLSPIKKVNQNLSRQSTITIELNRSRKKVQPQVFDYTPKANSQRNSVSLNSYAKIHSKKKSPTKKMDEVHQRNQQWKCRLEEKIKTEKKKKEENELRNCTFRPKILEKSIKKRRSLGSPEFSQDLKEIVYLIDDLNKFNNKLKNQKQQ